MKALLASRPNGDGNVAWRFQDVEVCRRGWMALHAMGNVAMNAFSNMFVN